MKRFVLWAVLASQPDYMERLITDTDTQRDIQRARDWATSQGFNRFRVSEYDTTDTTAPDFVESIAI